MIGYVIILLVGSGKNKMKITVLTIILSFIIASTADRYVEKQGASLWKRFFEKTVGLPIQYLKLLIAGMLQRSKPAG